MTVMLVAAEASGDRLGAGLARALRARLGDRLRLAGVGGARMAAEGVSSPFDIADLSVLGFVEGLAAYPRVVRRAREAAALAAASPPDIAVLIDSWGFTLRVARRLRRAHPTLPLVKYVGPQVWASRPGRARTLAGAVDHLLTLRAFEAAPFEAAGLPVTVVGDPALARPFTDADPARLRARIGAAEGDRILLVLPGSRPAELARLRAPFEDAVARVRQGRPDLHVVVPAAGTLTDAVRAWVAGWPFRAHVLEDEAGHRDAMRAATVALACSGTVTTELAMAGAPMVVGYRLGALSHALMKRVVVTPDIVLLNVAAGRRIVPELVQGACTGPALAAELAPRLDDPALRARQTAEQDAALDALGRGVADPDGRAADAVLAVLHARRGRQPGGRGGIRTHGALSRTAVFKTAAIDHSATRPSPRA